MLLNNSRSEVEAERLFSKDDGSKVRFILDEQEVKLSFEVIEMRKKASPLKSQTKALYYNIKIKLPMSRNIWGRIRAKV